MSVRRLFCNSHFSGTVSSRQDRVPPARESTKNATFSSTLFPAQDATKGFEHRLLHTTISHSGLRCLYCPVHSPPLLLSVCHFYACAAIGVPPFIGHHEGPRAFLHSALLHKTFSAASLMRHSKLAAFSMEDCGRGEGADQNDLKK